MLDRMRRWLARDATPPWQRPFPPGATAEDILACFRLLLGRPPNREEWVGHASRTGEPLEAVVASYLRSLEFARRGLLARPASEGLAIAEAPGFRMHVSPGDKDVGHHVLGGAYEPDVTAVFRRILQPGMGVIDIGANIGWFTMLASTIIGEQGHIHAFEPHPVIGAHLARSIALNGLEHRITLRRAGLWDAPGEMSLAWSPETDNPGGTCLLPDAIAQGIPGSRVPLMTLDSLGLARCDLMKVDIEGAEYRLMRGADATLARCRPIILSELHYYQLPRVSGASNADYLALMEQAGYACFVLRGPERGTRVESHDPRWADAFTDILFVPRERVEEVTAKIFEGEPRA